MSFTSLAMELSPASRYVDWPLRDNIYVEYFDAGRVEMIVRGARQAEIKAVGQRIATTHHIFRNRIDTSCIR